MCRVEPCRPILRTSGLIFDDAQIVFAVPDIYEVVDLIIWMFKKEYPGLLSTNTATVESELSVPHCLRG